MCARDLQERDSMNSQWQTFLADRSAVIDNAGRSHFPDSPASADCALVDLSHLGLIALEGPEAAIFLQGQVTNDINAIGTTRTQLSAHCNPKGRMLASFRVLRQDERIYLLLHRSMVPGLLQRLRMFLLRAKATISDASDELVAVGLAGDCAHALLAPHFAELPQGDNDLTRAGELTAIRLPAPVPRFLLVGPPGTMKTLWADLEGQAQIVDPDYWALLDIHAGLPQVLPETREAFVPQMVNLQLIDGVSFTKGCYTGQEVVARMQYLGKLKRRMYRAQVASERSPSPGDELYAEGSSSEQGAGRVVDARASGPGRYELLAVVEIDAAEGQAVRLGGPEGPILTLSPPPYGFPA
jgi:folate-binding protein YgfZ